MSLLSTLMPREGQFFTLFNDHAALVVQGGRELFELLQEYDNVPGRGARISRIEEIEHKGVAYDTFLHATRDWSRLRRYRLKSVMMLLVTFNFLRNRWADTLELLAQDGAYAQMWALQAQEEDAV